ncbi:hypothetical protein E5206_10895 [Arthrobacter sp. PAMC25564]|uniref:hypothetical protein n=1 Tax=Arthrobacter sp. PAMC25564 TaxID=2565366 RepID=UPI0010A249D1|nr:hypothetical protein [Arthrobacter sp. PAMC25564]QCB97365.1 hypothetical protein E5206_10895 [Arthrobacter sp. PAMC25564]
MNQTPATPGRASNYGHTPRPDRDHRPGLRTLLVPRLLSRGLTPAQAARTTRVPVPLVSLIADHEPGTPTPSRTSAPPRLTRPASVPVPVRGRKKATRARLLFIAAIAAGCIGSILWHEPLLPIVLVAAGTLAGNSLRDLLPAGRRHAPRT